MRSAAVPANVLSTAIIRWRPSRVVTRTLAALLPPLAAFALGWLLWRYIQPHVWFLFFPAVFLSAWLGGLYGGLLATALSAVLVWQVFMGQAIPALIFSATGGLFSLFSERVRQGQLYWKKALEERQVFASLVDNSSDFIGIADPEGRPIYVNPAGRKMVGLAQDFPIGDTQIVEYYPVDQRPLAANVILRSMVEHGHWQGETYFRNWQTERPIPVSDTHFLIRDRETGQTLGMGTITRDISDRKRAEAEHAFLAEVGVILSSTLDYEQTLENIAELTVRDLADFCIVDVIGTAGQVQKLEVASRDPAHAELCEALGRVHLDPDRPYLTESAVRTGRPILHEHVTPEIIASYAQGDEHLELLRRLGARSMILVPLIARGTPLGAIALVSSSAERSYGREDLRLAEELARRAALSIDNARLYSAAQHAIRSRDDVLAIVAHDLRNPLNAIRIQLELCEIGATAEQRLRIAGIERSAARINRLIEDLLDVTRIESGGLILEQRAVAATEVLADAFRAQQELAGSAGIALELDVPDELPEIRADRDRVLQILENLIGNALKFTPPGGNVTIGATARGGDVMFRVADTGSGIEPEHQPHVFDRFWQARGGRHGAGLGLPIVKGLVEAHGGQVWLESTPGRGSTFYFTLPVRR